MEDRVSIHFSVEDGIIEVEQKKGPLISRKEISRDQLLNCFRKSVYIREDAPPVLSSGFLPLNTLAVRQTKESVSVVVWYPRLRADLSLYKTPYPDFPIPRLVFGFSVGAADGAVSACRIGVIADETPTPDTIMYHYHSQYAQALADTQKQINELGMELARHRHILAGLQPGIRCPMCYQTVTQETLPALKDEFEATIRRICAQGKELSGQLDELHGLDEKAREVFEAFRAQDIAMCNLELADIELRRQQAVDAVRAENERRQQKISEIREEIQNIELDLETGRLSSEEMVELECFKERAKALEAEIEVLTEQQGSSMGADVAPGISAEEINAEIVKKNELLTALSSYIAERVRQRFDHLDLNRVSISLYEVSKTTGEVRDVFKFNYEDRPYVILSLSEKIKAGLEVSELLKKIAGINYPVFIDNGESVPVIDNVRPSGQTFISQVVKNEQLRVEILGAAPAGRSEQAA